MAIGRLILGLSHNMITLYRNDMRAVTMIVKK
jgi:hypothetical protein